MADKPRNNTRHREAAAASRTETRRRLIDAAGIEFVELGYVAATVNRIAARAGVSVQTLYLACGSKPQLLRSFMEQALAPGADDPRRFLLEQLAPVDPADRLHRLAQVFRETCERASTGWALYRDASAVDPAIAEDWQHLQMLRRGTFAAVLQDIDQSTLRIPREIAADTAWAIASPETYDLLVRRAGYSLDRYEEWLGMTLCAALLATPGVESHPGR